MAAYLTASALSGLTALAYALVLFDAGFWAAAGYYVTGAWCGFAAMIALSLLVDGMRKALRYTPDLA